MIRRALALEREARGEGQDVRWLVAGKKGRSTLRFRRYEIAYAWVDFTDRPTYSNAERDRARGRRALHRRARSTAS